MALVLCGHFHFRQITLEQGYLETSLTISWLDLGFYLFHHVGQSKQSVSCVLLGIT